MLLVSYWTRISVSCKPKKTGSRKLSSVNYCKLNYKRWVHGSLTTYRIETMIRQQQTTPISLEAIQNVACCLWGMTLFESQKETHFYINSSRLEFEVIFTELKHDITHQQVTILPSELTFLLFAGKYMPVFFINCCCLMKEMRAHLFDHLSST